MNRYFEGQGQIRLGTASDSVGGKHECMEGTLSGKGKVTSQSTGFCGGLNCLL